MNKNMQRYNTFRNRWVGAYLTNKGIRVIPTISWGLENTFDFCFNGIEKGSTVAVSTYMACAHGTEQTKKTFLWLATMKCLSVLNLKQSFAGLIF